MPNAAPYEVIMGPMELWLAPVGTAFPFVDTAPSGSWTKVGTSGNRNYTDDGVTVTAPQTLAYFRGLGSTVPIKAIRSEEDVMVEVTVADLSLEQIKHALNGNSITTVAAGGEAGYKKINLYRGPDVTQMALLARGPSPYTATGYGQFELPVVVIESDISAVYTKSGEPATMTLVFRAMADLLAAEAEQIGCLRAMTAVAVS